jgi:hypothetical protein
MFRSGGTRRTKRFHEPQARKVNLNSAYENYGIITGYHGGAGRYCTVQAYTPEDKKVEELRQVRLKGAITHPKCKQRIVVGSYVLLEYGEIALIYKNNSLIPPEILTALENAAGEVSAAERGVTKKDPRDYSSEDETEEESDAEDPDNANEDPDLI